jgi:hypothetical protein
MVAGVHMLFAASLKRTRWRTLGLPLQPLSGAEEKERTSRKFILSGKHRHHFDGKNDGVLVVFPDL